MDSLISLSSNEIHLWLAYYEKADDRLYDTYHGLLNTEERNQELRFHFIRDRHRYLVTRALVRTVLSRYVPVQPEDWIFSTNRYGRPEIANGDAGGSQISFNISHTHSLIVLGVTKNRALGVDVENLSRRVSIDIADRYFAPQEVAALAAVAPHQQQYRFFEYWTFKESYIKARGMGLSLPLDKFSFEYPHERAVAMVIHPELGDHAERWQFWQFRPAPEYLVALCAEGISTQPSTLFVRQIIPLIEEKVFTPEFLRISEQGVDPRIQDDKTRVR